MTIIRNFLLAVFCTVSVSWQSLALADTIVIGQVAPLTGTNAVDGILLSRGAKLYFDQINATGGVNGHRIQFIVRDDQSKVDETVRQATELVNQQKIMAMMSTVGT